MINANNYSHSDHQIVENNESLIIRHLYQNFKLTNLIWENYYLGVIEKCQTDTCQLIDRQLIVKIWTDLNHFDYGFWKKLQMTFINGCQQHVLSQISKEQIHAISLSILNQKSDSYSSIADLHQLFEQKKISIIFDFIEIIDQIGPLYTQKVINTLRKEGILFKDFN